MNTLIKPQAKLKIASFDYSTYQVEKKIIKSEKLFGLKFYQKIILIILTSCTFLIFPESPVDSEVLCNRYHSKQACIVW